MPDHPTFYHKMHLVPFGEFIPLIDAFPWLSALTPYRDKIPKLSFGTRPRIFEVGPYRFAAVDLLRGHDPPGHRPLLPAAANQADQPDCSSTCPTTAGIPSSSELDMHLAIGVFRTVEHRVPLARAVNTGLSALVDGNGEIRAMLPKNVEDVLTVTVPLDDRTTYYSRWGDWLGLSCLAVTIGWIPVGLVRNRKPPLAPQIDQSSRIPRLTFLAWTPTMG